MQDRDPISEGSAVKPRHRLQRVAVANQVRIFGIVCDYLANPSWACDPCLDARAQKMARPDRQQSITGFHAEWRR